MCKQLCFLKPTTFGDKLKNSLLEKKKARIVRFFASCLFYAFSKIAGFACFFAGRFCWGQEKTHGKHPKTADPFWGVEKITRKNSKFSKKPQHFSGLSKTRKFLYIFKNFHTKILKKKNYDF